MKTHKHHKIPKHAGGSDGLSNIEVLTIEEHAEAHRLLYEKYGRWQDKCAWRALSGLDENVRNIASLEGKRELYADPVRFAAFKLAISNGLKKAYENGLEVWNKGKTKNTDARCLKISENVKRQSKTENFHCIGDYQRGRAFDQDHRQKLSERAQQREKKFCYHCQDTFSPAMFARWHGDNCKRVAK